MILSTGFSFFGRNDCPAGISFFGMPFFFFFAPFFEGEPFSLILEAEMQTRAAAKGPHRQADSADGGKPPRSPRMERNLPQRRGAYTY